MKDKNRGQSFLELAIMLPFLLVVLFGIFDLGRAFFSTITLISAAREGARYLSAYPGDVSNTLGQFFSTKQIAIAEAGNSGVALTTDQVTVECDNNDEEPDECDGGSPAIVTVTYDFNLVLGWLLPNPIPLSRSAQMVVP